MPRRRSPRAKRVEEYVRIKIFTQEGTKYGHIEIPFSKAYQRSRLHRGPDDSSRTAASSNSTARPSKPRYREGGGLKIYGENVHAFPTWDPAASSSTNIKLRPSRAGSIRRSGQCRERYLHARGSLQLYARRRLHEWPAPYVPLRLSASGRRCSQSSRSMAPTCMLVQRHPGHRRGAVDASRETDRGSRSNSIMRIPMPRRATIPPTNIGTITRKSGMANSTISSTRRMRSTRSCQRSSARCDTPK